jgi:hypothetical protein
MTALSDQCNIIRGWLNLGVDVYPDEVVTSWIRMAEETLSVRLRCREMVQVDVGTLVNQRYTLPLDWREMEFVRVIDGGPLRYTTRDDFYNTDEEYVEDRVNTYTMIGKYFITGASTSGGTQVEISYYGDIEPLNATPTWLVTKYPTLFICSVLNVASSYAIEDERGPLWKSGQDEQIDAINAEHAKAKASGSRLTQRHRRSFG